MKNQKRIWEVNQELRFNNFLLGKVEDKEFNDDLLRDRDILEKEIIKGGKE